MSTQLPPVFLPEEFLTRLVSTFDDETVTAIICTGAMLVAMLKSTAKTLSLVRRLFVNPL